MIKFNRSPPKELRGGYMLDTDISMLDMQSRPMQAKRPDPIRVSPKKQFKSILPKIDSKPKQAKKLSSDFLLENQEYQQAYNRIKSQFRIESKKQNKKDLPYIFNYIEDERKSTEMSTI